MLPKISGVEVTPSITSVESSEQFWRKIRQIWRICEPWTSIMRNLKTCPPFSCHKFIFCPHAIIPPCNLICQIYQRKKKKTKREGDKKRKLLSSACFLYTMWNQGICDTAPHILFFFVVVVFVAYCLPLKKVTIEF